MPEDVVQSVRSGRSHGGGGGGGGSAGDSGAYHAADNMCRPSQVPSSAKRAATSPSLVSGWLFNIARETSPPSAGPGPVACAYGDGIGVAPSGLPRELTGMGGPAVLFPLLQRAQTEAALCWTLGLIRRVVRGGGASSIAYMQTGGGYLILAGLLRSRRALLGPGTVRECFEMAVDRAYEDDPDTAGAEDNDGVDANGNSLAGVDEDGRQVEDDSGTSGGSGSSGGGGRDEAQPWGGADPGIFDERKAEEKRAAAAWGWEKDLTFMSRADIVALLRKAGISGRDESAGGSAGDEDESAVEVDGGKAAGGKGSTREHGRTRRLCPFVLLTDPYALKYLLMNHQVRCMLIST